MKPTLTPQQLAQKTWDLYQTHGVPIELSEDILSSHGLVMDINELNTLIESHQQQSQTSSAGQFKSGLGTDSKKGIALHTTTHILHQVLRDMFGKDVKQTGSAITDEKARFDFTSDIKPSPEQVEEIESKVQHIINTNYIMSKIETSPDKAIDMGAIGLFGEKYGSTVTVYSLTDNEGKVFSREFCGGPHVNSTSEIGIFKVLKVKSVGQGVKRIEYTVE